MSYSLPANYEGLCVGLPPITHTLGLRKRLPLPLQSESVPISELVKYYDQNHHKWTPSPRDERDEANSTRKRKRSYASTTLEERALLDCYPYKPCVQDEKLIGALLQWPVRRVQMWFHNNR
jgi:hypothetical protein